MCACSSVFSAQNTNQKNAKQQFSTYLRLQMNSSEVFSNLGGIKYHHTLLFIYLILVTHPKTLATSQIPQGQPKGAGGEDSSSSHRPHSIQKPYSHPLHTPPEPCCSGGGGMICRETWYVPFQTPSPSQQQTAEAPITHAITKSQLDLATSLCWTKLDHRTTLIHL